MQIIRTTTLIEAPVPRCFLLALNVDLQLHSAARTGERIIGDAPTGILQLGQSVTWSGRHLGLRFDHTAVIDALRPYSYFRDTMSQGRFASFQHDHHFAPLDASTRVRDEIRFEPPHGLVGRLLRKRLEKRLRSSLLKRNAILKRVAESEEWHQYLDNQADPTANNAPATDPATRLTATR